VSGSVETVEDRAGNVGELVDLLRGEPVEDQASDLLGVVGDGCLERGAAGGVDGPPVAAVPLDQAAPAHPAQLVVQPALLPPEATAELEDPQADAMQTTDNTARRTVVRVEDKIPFGADSRVDDRNVLITPMNPALTDPFLLLSEDWFSTSGFEWHPHRGLETVTLVLDGVLEHGDNLGNAGALTTGDIQWMTAGRGIIHRELAFRNERAHTLQLWVNLPGELKMVGTRYQDPRAADSRS
jgi:hypothetical protein